MTFPSHPSSVPLFHSLGNGTVEQTFNQRNSPWNIGGTNSLKALANKVLERNKEWNTYGTMTSKSVPPPDQSVPLRGTNAEVGCKDKADNFLYDFEERLAIAEIDGNQTPIEAHRIAYLDTFISILSALAENDPYQGWLAEKIETALTTLEIQNFPKLN